MPWVPTTEEPSLFSMQICEIYNGKTKEGAEILPISDFPFPNTIFHVVLTETIEMNEQTGSKTTTRVSFSLQSTRRRDTAPPNRYASPFAVPRST